MEDAAKGLIRAMCLFAAWEYPPTRAEWMAGAGCETCNVSRREVGMPTESSAKRVALEEMEKAIQKLINNHVVIELRGRIIFSGQNALIEEHEKREVLFARKFRRSRWVTRWLAMFGGVKFVALCNTTARAHADENSDLDFFVIAKRGRVWQTRLWATLPFRLLGWRPRADRAVRDAVCLSFFIDEDAFDLSPLMLPDDDPDFRHWFLSFLPLYDDGVGEIFWRANKAITNQHPFALPWIVNPDARIKKSFARFPSFAFLEPFARALQTHFMNQEIAARMNRNTTVVVNDHVMKFHVHDGRAAYRERYVELRNRYEVSF